MPVYTAIPFYLAIATYLLAAAVSLWYLKGADPRALLYAKRAAAVATVLLIVVFVVRGWEYRLIPLTGLGDSMNLFLVLCTGIMLVIQRNEAMRPLLCFYLPALGPLALICAVAAPQHLDKAPRELNGVLLTVHVGLAFLAFALFFVASLTSMAYTFQAQRLKRRRITGLFQRLPSLERLDLTLYGLIRAGYPLFVITFVFGLFWAWKDSDLLGPYWYVSPKVVLAFIMAAFYSFSFHIRRMGRLRGPKLAYLVFFGFTILLAAYVVLGLLQLGTYSFWETDA